MNRTRVAGYLFALGAGATWGTTGVLSTALFHAGQDITGIGFWRVSVGVVGLFLYMLFFHPDLLKADLKGWLLVFGGGGLLVAVFEVAYPYAITGVSVAGAAALLYLAPVVVAVLARFILGEALTPLRMFLAVLVMIGVGLTVSGGDVGSVLAGGPGFRTGVLGGLIAMLSYAGTTLLARWSVPRYGAIRSLFLELSGGAVMMAIFLTLFGRSPFHRSPEGGIPYPVGLAAWGFCLAQAIGPVVGANFLFFAGVRRIDAAPTAVAATVEPVVGTLLAFFFFSQHLTALGWLGLLLVVGGVATSYRSEARGD
ncbi:MAG TPA: EamA family transporter [Gemmatimonadales bacterium]|nr:EamA family transporter [Gemmatimonadales bacterium]